MLLRNQLWNSVFQLVTALLSRKQGYEAVRNSLFHCGHGPYIETLILAVQDKLHSNLCYSALTCFIALLSFEMKEEVKSSNSLQDLFDSKSEVEEISEKSQGKIIEDESPKEIIPPLVDLPKYSKRTFLFSEDTDREQKSKSSDLNISTKRNDTYSNYLTLFIYLK